MRLQKYIRDAGLVSRRAAEELIKEGKVSVNGEIVLELGSKVKAGDKIYVNGKRIYLNRQKIYIKINKPEGIVTSLKDEFNRPVIRDLIDINDRIFPVGRLDMDSSGLLLLTNDGQWANMVSHPSNEIEKKYLVKVDKLLTNKEMEIIKNGIEIGGKTTYPAKIFKRKGNNYEVIIHEGRNRQVRKMFAAISKTVVELHRIQIGNIKLGDLGSGDWKPLSQKELDGIRKLVER